MSLTPSCRRPSSSASTRTIPHASDCEPCQQGDEPMMSKQAPWRPGSPSQMQSEESLPALDDEERKAVQMRARDRLNARNGRSGDSQISPTLKSSARSPGKSARSSSRLPGYMTPKTERPQAATAAKSSRSAMLTNRTPSPTGRYHPVAERKWRFARCAPPAGFPRDLASLEHREGLWYGPVSCCSSEPTPMYRANVPSRTDCTCLLAAPSSSHTTSDGPCFPTGGPPRKHRLPRPARCAGQRPQSQGEQLAGVTGVHRGLALLSDGASRP